MVVIHTMERLKVFISSTQKDLQTERNSVEALIEQMGYECLRSEKFNAPGVSPENACIQMARECDIYIGIFGGRYGYKPQHLDISVTELEYREARLHNPEKVFVYIKDTNDIELEQRRLLKEIQDFSEGYFRHEKFTDYHHLAEQVKRDIINWTTRQIRKALIKDLEVQALRYKVAHLSQIMEMYGIPEDFR